MRDIPCGTFFPLRAFPPDKNAIYRRCARLPTTQSARRSNRSRSSRESRCPILLPANAEIGDSGNEIYTERG
jgi:hypothetical protein